MKRRLAAGILHDPPIVLPKASRPLSEAHIGLLHLIAESIVDDHLKEREGSEAPMDPEAS